MCKVNITIICPEQSHLEKTRIWPLISSRAKFLFYENSKTIAITLLSFNYYYFILIDFNFLAIRHLKIFHFIIGTKTRRITYLASFAETPLYMTETQLIKTSIEDHGEIN